MKTLIELYDERPLENILATEVFRPDRVVFLCPLPVANDYAVKSNIREFFRHRGIKSEVNFVGAKMFETDELISKLDGIIKRYPDCAIDITGGTDAALFASGMISARTDIPAFTYSRRNNKFYNIRSAPFESELPCNVNFRVEDFFRMAGGAMKRGRVNNSILKNYLQDIDPFFQAYLRFRKDWVSIITYFQRASQQPYGEPVELDVSAPYQVKGERASRINAPEDALLVLEKIDFIRNLKIDRGNSVAFSFRDEQIRTWLRDIGSVLELYIYKLCLDSGLFNDVITSAIVEWERTDPENAVSNEIDVMCAKGIVPVFISCKTCEVKTEALNELAILRDRFGGRMAKAIIVTAEKGGTQMRNRAAELEIGVIDLPELASGRAKKRIMQMLGD